MSSLFAVLAAGCVFLNLSPVDAVTECPGKMPILIGNRCYHFQTYPMPFNAARQSCMRVDAGGMMTSYNTEEVLDKLQMIAQDIVSSKLKYSGVFWIGIKMEDRSLSKTSEDRLWTVDYDDSQFVQKDYKYWDTEGGPTDMGLTCAAINSTNDWKVMAVDCGGPRLGFICMMKEGERCHHNSFPYLAYGKYCIGVVRGARYNALHSACSPNQPAPYQNEDHMTAVKRAVKNSFLYGGIFMNMRRNGSMFVDLADGSSPPDSMWEEGEPRDEYDCVALSFQPDNTLKLRTINCNFKALSLCSMDMPEEV